MKFNFGHGVFVGAAAFVAFIVFLVSNMLQQDIDLVAEDYYEEGLDYQQKIDEAKESLRPDFFSSQPSRDGVAFHSRESLASKQIALSFYRPSDSGMDFQTIVKQADSHTIKLQDTRLSKGFWRATISWKDGEDKFFSEVEFMMP